MSVICASLREFPLSITAAFTWINSVTLKLEISRPSIRHLISTLCENPNKSIIIAEKNLKNYTWTIHRMNYRFLTTVECNYNTNLHSTSHMHNARVLNLNIWDLRFSQRCCWRFKFSGTSQRAVRRLMPNILKEHLQDEVIQEYWRSRFSLILRNFWNYSSNERAISQKTWVFNPICHIPNIMPRMFECNSNHTALQIITKYSYRWNVIFYLTW